MSPSEIIDGIAYYYNDELGVELTPVPLSYTFHDECTPVEETLTLESKQGWAVGHDTLLQGHEVIVWDDGYIGSIHESHLIDLE